MRVAASAGSSSLVHQPVQRGDEDVRPVPDRGQLLGGRQAGQVRRGRFLFDFAPDRGHTDHEELVEIRRGDGRELDPLEQRRRGIRRLLEHALVEGQPRQLAIEEERGRRRSRDDPGRTHDRWPAVDLREHVGTGRRRQLLHRQVALPFELQRPGRAARAPGARRGPSAHARHRARSPGAGSPPAC